MKDVTKIFLGVLLALIACPIIFLMAVMFTASSGDNTDSYRVPVAATGNNPSSPPKVISPLKAVKVDSRVVDNRGKYSDVSWLVTVKNENASSKTFTAHITFLDKDGFVLDEAYGWDLEIPGNTTKDYSDTVLLTTINVESTTAIRVVLED